MKIIKIQNVCQIYLSIRKSIFSAFANQKSLEIKIYSNFLSISKIHNRRFPIENFTKLKYSMQNDKSFTTDMWSSIIPF